MYFHVITSTQLFSNITSFDVNLLLPKLEHDVVAKHLRGLSTESHSQFTLYCVVRFSVMSTKMLLGKDIEIRWSQARAVSWARTVKRTRWFFQNDLECCIVQSCHVNE